MFHLPEQGGDFFGDECGRVPGQIILYPGGISETEILLAYGGVNFASKMCQLAGNRFITITGGLENLHKLGNLVLWDGEQDIHFELAAP